jgi:hypothetical protein
MWVKILPKLYHIPFFAKHIDTILMLHPGFEPGLPRPQRGVLTTRLMERFNTRVIMFWRYRVSIPVPRACKARTLPIELYPLLLIYFVVFATTRIRTLVICLGSRYANHYTIVALIIILNKKEKCGLGLVGL